MSIGEIFLKKKQNDYKYFADLKSNDDSRWMVIDRFFYYYYRDLEGFGFLDDSGFDIVKHNKKYFK